MDQANLQTRTAAPALHILLPGDRAEWPHEARFAYRRLLRELDRWCRQQGWPATRNAAVAEEAVRQAW